MRLQIILGKFQSRRLCVKIICLTALLILSIVIFTSFYTFCFEPLPDWSWMLKQQKPLHLYVKPQKDTLLLAPNPQFCLKDLFLVIVVCSAINNFENRKAIRETWASRLTDDVRVVFLLGKPSLHNNNTNHSSRLAFESKVFGDIIQEDFIDTYNNLTIKTVMLLKWKMKYCSHAKYIMKADDDVFVHLQNLFTLLRTNTSPDLLLGFRFTFNGPFATCFAKNYLPHAVYRDILYPHFLYGPSYLMSGNVAQLLYSKALQTYFLYVEDLFLTGICAEQVGIKRTDHVGFLYFSRFWVDKCKFREVMITEHLRDNSKKKMRKLWALINNKTALCTSELINDVLS